MKDNTENLPLSVHILGTSRCNLSCNHCFVDTSIKNTNIMDIAANNIIELVQNIFIFNRLSDIELEGGEILLHPDIEKIVAGIPVNYIAQLTITTNGTIPFDFRKIVSYETLSKLKLRISIEGHNQSVHEKIRNSSLSVVFSNLTQWIYMGINPIIRITLNSYNYQYIQDMVDRVYSLGVKNVQLFEYQPCGRGAEFSKKYFLLNNDEFVKTLYSLVNLKIPSNDFQISLKVPAMRKTHIESILSQITERYEIIKNSNVNTLVINWDESVSCCPWRSFGRILGQIDYDHFTAYVKHIIANNMLAHECKYCSKYTIKTKDMSNDDL